MPYFDCLTWNDPNAARLRHAGPLLRDHPNIRALMVCEDCGQRWLFDLLDSADWGGEGDGRVIYSPEAVAEAVAGDTCADLTARDVEALHPRLVIHDISTDRVERVA